MKDDEISYVDRRGVASRIDPAKMTPLQRLKHANAGSTNIATPQEVTLTDEERGMCPAAFAKLSALDRLKIANAAIAARRLAAGA